MAARRRHPGITERRLSNKRFRKTEEAILEAFFKCEGGIETNRMAHKARVARATVYYHHAAVREILPDYKKYIIGKYGRIMRPILEKSQVRMRNIYLMNLTFIVAHRRIFLIFMKVRDREVMWEMINRLRGRVERFARLPKNSEEMFRVYRGEIIELLEGWGERGFGEEEMPDMLDKVMYLTETMRERLKPLMK